MRRMSRDYSMPCLPYMCDEQDRPNHKRTLKSSRKSRRSMSRDHSMPCIFVNAGSTNTAASTSSPLRKNTHNVPIPSPFRSISSKNIDLQEKEGTAKKQARGSTMPLIDSFDKFQDSKQGLSGNSRIASPQKPTRKMSRDSSMPFLSTTTTGHSTTKRRGDTGKKPTFVRAQSVPVIKPVGSLKDSNAGMQQSNSSPKCSRTDSRDDAISMMLAIDPLYEESLSSLETDSFDGGSRRAYPRCMPKPVIRAFEEFSVCQASLSSVSEKGAPRKPARTLSRDDSTLDFVGLHQHLVSPRRQRIQS